MICRSEFSNNGNNTAEAQAQASKKQPYAMLWHGLTKASYAKLEPNQKMPWH